MGGSVTVTASAADDVGVAGVQFLLDGAALGAEDTTAPYSVAWNTAGLSNGEHVLTAVARDAAGRSTMSTNVNVTVANDVTAPQIALSTPGGSVSGTITLAATASDDFGVTGVQFTVDGIPVGVERTSAPYEFAWDSSTESNGVHVLAAVARDAAGHTTTASSVSVSVSNDLAAPVVALSTTSGTVSGSLTIAATASDDIGVAGVQFFVDGEPLGNEDATADYDVAWDTTTAANGTHVLTAVARDAAGRTTAAEPVTVTVANDLLN